MEHATPNSKEIEARSHNPVPQGYVLVAGEGDHLIHFRDGGNIFINIDPVKASNNLGLGTQQLPKGSGIRFTVTSTGTKPSTFWKAVAR